MPELHRTDTPTMPHVLPDFLALAVPILLGFALIGWLADTTDPTRGESGGAL